MDALSTASSFAKRVADKVRRVQPNTVDPTTGADVLSHIPVRADNFQTQPGPGCRVSAAYTQVGINGQASQMHFCQENGFDAYAFKSLGDIQCSDLSADVDMKMMTLGGSVLVHELT